VKRLIKALSLPNRQAQTIFTLEISDVVLSPIEKQILLLLEETNTQDRIILLTQVYGKIRTASLIQSLLYQYFFGSEFYKIKNLGWSRSAYYSAQKECREIGVVTLFDTPKTKIQVGNVS
jgi:hypothetical protein